MKKVMMLIASVTAFSFLVSITVVAPSFAVQSTKTTPTTKQKTPAQTQTENLKPQAYEKAKEKFWDLEVVSCQVSGVGICGLTCEVKREEKLIGHCKYKVKTPPINDITEADANFWGQGGKSYRICASLTNPVNKNWNEKSEHVIILPQFTWRDVLGWKRGGAGNVPKAWESAVSFTFENIGRFPNKGNPFLFHIDINNDVKEYMERNNTCSGIINLFVPGINL